MSAAETSPDRSAPLFTERSSGGLAGMGLGDRSLRLLLLLAFGLQLLSWSNLHGYQLADSVEYMERAQALARSEEVIDSVSIRSFGFVSLFAPIFALADLIGLEDFKPVVGLIRLLQMLLGLELIRITVQIGARIAGRRAGLIAGLAIALNPYFLLYSVSPVSGIAAGVCIGHALNRLIFRADFRSAFIGGLWLGGALLVAYKTILLALPMIAFVFLADRFQRWRSWVGSSAGYAVGILGAIGLDKLCYGVWGESIDLYVRQNFGQLASRLCLQLKLWDAAKWFWEYAGGVETAYTANPETVLEITKSAPNPLYHLLNFNDFLVWPLLVLGVVAVVQVMRRGNRPARILTAVFAISIVAVSLKKSQDFRLLLPLLPCVGVLCGLGWQSLFGQRFDQKPIFVLGAGLIVAGGFIGWSRLGEINDSRYSGYWRAMDRVNQIAELTTEQRKSGSKLRVASTWHWAVFLRESARVELIKMPHQLDRWPNLDSAFRDDDLEAIASLDMFVTHLAVLLGSADLFDAINAQFEVDAVLYDREAFENLGPIVIFKRRSGSRGALAFQTRTIGTRATDYAREHGLQPGLALSTPDGAKEAHDLQFLGWKYEALPGDGHGWLSLHWQNTASSPTGEYLIRPRIHTQVVPQPWEEQHLLGRSFYPPKAWLPGEIVSEGWPVVAAVAPFDSERSWLPIYGDHPPGSTLPASLWLRVIPLAEDGYEAAPLLPMNDDESSAPDVQAEGFIRLGEFELIVPPDHR